MAPGRKSAKDIFCLLSFTLLLATACDSQEPRSDFQQPKLESRDWDNLKQGGVVFSAHEGVVEVQRNTPGIALLKVRSQTGGWVILGTEYGPGWSARVDGLPDWAYRIADTFCGVHVPAGEHYVSFRFSWGAAHLRTILFVAAAIIGIIASIFLYRALRTRVIDIPGIGSIRVRHSVGLAQLLTQHVAAGFLILGSIGLGTVIKIGCKESTNEIDAGQDLNKMLAGLLMSGCLLSIGALLKWGAKRIRKSLFLSGEWFLFLENSIRRGQISAAKEAANRLINVAVPSNATGAKMLAHAHTFLALQDPSDRSHLATARSLLEQILATEPEHPQAKELLQALEDQGRTEEKAADSAKP